MGLYTIVLYGASYLHKVTLLLYPDQNPDQSVLHLSSISIYRFILLPLEKTFQAFVLLNIQRSTVFFKLNVSMLVLILL